jgi:hypothetical protein
MDQRRVRRELLMRITAELASGPEDRYGPEARALAECCVYNRYAKTWELRLGDLGADALGRLAALLRAAQEHGTNLGLSAIIAPHAWRDPALTWPVPLGPFQTDHGDIIDPSGASTMLVIDVNAGPNGPAQQWWLAAEPPLGTHPRLEEACRLLREFDDDDDPFAPFNGPSIQQWFGPESATVRGFWRGRWIQAHFEVNDGGEYNRWKRLVPVLPLPQYDHPSGQS